MIEQKLAGKTPAEVDPEEVVALRARLEDVEGTLRAIRTGEADALLVHVPGGPRVYTLVTADQSYRTLVEQMREAALILTQGGTVLYCNGRLAALLGIEANTLPSRELPEFVLAEDRERLFELLYDARSGEAVGEVRFARAGAEPVPVQLSFSTLQTGSFIGLACIGTDLTEQKRREREAQWQRLTTAVLEFAGAAILVCDGQGRILQANQLAAMLLGDGLASRLLSEVLPLRTSLAALQASGKAEEYQVRAHGRTATVLLRVRSPGDVLPSRGALWVLTLTDITHRKHAEEALRESEQRFRVALENSPVVVASCDRELRYTWMFNTHPGFEPGAMIGHRDDELGSAHDVEELVRLKQDALAGGGTIRREIAWGSGPRRRYYDVTAEPLHGPGGRIDGVITAASDVTELRCAEQEAERANRVKSEFLAVMSHELRTPLNSVIGYADLLLMGTQGALSEGQKLYADRIHASAHHQLALIEEILAYTRIEGGHESARIMPTNAARLIRDAVEFVRPQAEAKQIALVAELGPAPLELVTDPAKFRQISLNLIANAVKFTPSGRVSVSAAFQEEELVMYVRDTGPGIPEDMQDMIFQPFTQVDQSATRESGGAGLGLAIAARMTDLLGGRIEVHSKVGEGTTFTVRLPRRMHFEQA